MLWVKVPTKVRTLLPNERPSYHAQALLFVETVLGGADYDPNFINSIAAPIYKPQFASDHVTLPTGYHGIHNSGLTCYMNALLQMLYHCPEFRKAVAEEQALQEAYYQPNYQCGKSVLCKLNMIFKRLDQGTVPAAGIVDLLVTLANRVPGTDYIRNGGLQTGDPDEALMPLLGYLTSELEAIHHQPMRFSRFSDIFSVVGYNHTICNLAPAHPQRYQAYDFEGIKCSFPHKQVALPNHANVQYTLANLVGTALLTWKPKRPGSHPKASGCVVQEHRITKHLPPYLWIKLQRNVGQSNPAANTVTFPVK